MHRDFTGNPRPDQLLQVLRALENLRSQLGKHADTLDKLNFVIESIVDGAAAPARRRPRRNEKREQLLRDAAMSGADRLAVCGVGSTREFRFDGGPWIAFPASEGTLLLALARGKRGGDDGYGAFIPYDLIAREIAPRITHRALVQRVYRLRRFLGKHDSVNPYWVETLSGVGLRLKLRLPLEVACERP